MPRFFNTAGSCRADDHYMLPAAERLPEVLSLVENKAYFVLHAPRQMGKTTSMMALAVQLTASGRYAALHATCEVAAVEPHNPIAGIAHANRLPPDTSPICSAKPPISRPSIAHATP